MYSCLARGERSLPSSISDIRISLSECSFDTRGCLNFRNRVYVPNYEPLQTGLIQETHDSPVTGHPGRDSTLAIRSRNYFWPGISKVVRRFCRNCDVCGRTHVWREMKKRLLHPLPIPDRFHSELSIDFMTDLPAKSSSEPRYMLVIVDRLLGSVVIEDMMSMKAEECAKVFLKIHIRYHGFPSHITSDRGSNWVGDFWRELCRIIGMKQRLSTAFHPQTDGATERMNQEILSYLRAFITYAQFNWKDLLPCAMLALNNRTTTKLGISKPSEPAKRAQNFVNRLIEAEEYAQAAMASAQDKMEKNANLKRKEAECFKIGDKVWLNLKNVSTPQLSKKLSWINAKYEVVKVIDSHSVQLNTPSGIWPNFHVDLLKRAATDPFPSQINDDVQPPPVIPEAVVNNDIKMTTEPEQFFEKILRAEKRKIGKGFKRLVLVKWRGFAEPLWEPRENLEETEALDTFEAKYGIKDNAGEENGVIIGPRNIRKKDYIHGESRMLKKKKKIRGG